MRSADKDPRPGYYFIELSWGHNLLRNGTKKSTLAVVNPLNTYFAEDMITGYHILMVDDFGQQTGNTHITVPSTPINVSSCCNPAAYSVTLEGALAKGTTAFMIVPFQLVTVETGLVRKYQMPFGTKTARFIEWNDPEQSVSRVMGSSSIVCASEAGAKALASDVRTPKIARDALARSAGLQGGDVITGNFSAQKYFFTGTTTTTVTGSIRRLSSFKGRRLADEWEVIFDYAIMLTADYTGPVFTADSINRELLLAYLKVAIKEAGIKVDVTGVSAVVKEVTNVGVDLEEDSSSARPIAAGILAVIFACLGALRGWELLA